MSDDKKWIPNLVGGVPIWDYAARLNVAELFDGHLLEPEGEHPAQLIALPAAREQAPDVADEAMSDFRKVALRVAEAMSETSDVLEMFRSALVLPAFGAREGVNYFISLEEKKLYVTNWGAAPPSGSRSEVLAYYEWGRALRPERPAAKRPAPQDVAEERKRTWWSWPSIALLVVMSGLTAVFVFEIERPARSATRPDAGAPLAAKTPDPAPGDAAAETESIPPARTLVEEVEAGAETPENASADGSADADALRDGAADDTEIFDGLGDGGDVDVVTGPARGGRSGPHRRHDHAEAVHWRVTLGVDRVARTEQRGSRFDVWLAPAGSFQGVTVEWQDRSGAWHLH